MSRKPPISRRAAVGRVPSGWSWSWGVTAAPGTQSTNLVTASVSRRPCAIATATSVANRPRGSSHSRLNHRRPTRSRGATPWATGIDPAQVDGSMTSSPMVTWSRKLADGAAFGGSAGTPLPIWLGAAASGLPRGRTVTVKTEREAGVPGARGRRPRSPKPRSMRGLRGNQPTKSGANSSRSPEGCSSRRSPH